MTVELWYGSKPDNPAEQEVLIELYQYLMPQNDHYVMLVNFFCGSEGNEIDLVIIKENGIFLAELKHVWDPLVGSREGEWKVVRLGGQETTLNKGRANPFKQTQQNYYHWKNWCTANCETISVGIARKQSVNYTKVLTYIVLYPDLAEGSKVDIGNFPIQAVGFPKFRDSLSIRTSNQINLSRQEMSRIPQLLKLKEWKLTPMKTIPLADWQPETFAVLVTRGHNLSVAVFKLNALNKETITIGRHPGNDLMISHDAVSAHHAVIEQHQDRYVVRDLGSANGTYVSFSGDPNQEMDITGRTNAIKNNSIIRFGPASYTFICYE